MMTKHGKSPRKLADWPHRTRSWLKATALSGVVVLAPLGLTVYVLRGLVVSADQILDLLPEPLRPETAHRFPGAGLLLAGITVLLAGFVARNIVGSMLLAALARGVERIPVVASLYRLLRQIAEAFVGSGGDKGFKRVVLIEWPRREVWTLAFVTAEVRGPVAAALAAKRGAGGPLLSLFVPTTPNPTGGFYVIAPESDCVATPFSVEEAFKIIISGGALTP